LSLTVIKGLSTRYDNQLKR